MSKPMLAALLLAALTLTGGSCRQNGGPRYLVVTETEQFELQPGAGTLALPLFAGSLGVEQIVRDVSQAEYYYRKLSAVYGPQAFRFLADSTVDVLLARPGQLHAPQPVYRQSDGPLQMDLSLVAFENNTARYAFRQRDSLSGQVRTHPLDVPVGQSASVGLRIDSAQNRGYLVAVAVQALAIDKDLTPAQLAAFLHAKNQPRGAHSPSGYQAGDQRWMDTLFGARGIQLALDTTSTAEDAEAPFDTPPEPVGGMQALIARFVYPPSAVRDTVQGKVIVAVRIDAEGFVRGCRVVHSVRDDLDTAAVHTVRDVKFTPAQYQGKPVATTVMIPIAFRLQ